LALSMAAGVAPHPRRCCGGQGNRGAARRQSSRVSGARKSVVAVAAVWSAGRATQCAPNPQQSNSAIQQNDGICPKGSRVLV